MLAYSFCSTWWQPLRWSTMKFLSAWCTRTCRRVVGVSGLTFYRYNYHSFLYNNLYLQPMGWIIIELRLHVIDNCSSTFKHLQLSRSRTEMIMMIAFLMFLTKANLQKLKEIDPSLHGGVKTQDLSSCWRCSWLESATWQWAADWRSHLSKSQRLPMMTEQSLTLLGQDYMG